MILKSRNIYVHILRIDKLFRCSSLLFSLTMTRSPFLRKVKSVQKERKENRKKKNMEDRVGKFKKRALQSRCLPMHGRTTHEKYPRFQI